MQSLARIKMEEETVPNAELMGNNTICHLRVGRKEERLLQLTVIAETPILHTLPLWFL